MPNFAAFISYVLLTTFTPGPNNIMSMTNATQYGFKKSIRFNIGIFFGFFIIISLCSLFSFELYSFIPSIKTVMTFIGALYILFLAWKTYHTKPLNESQPGRSSNTLLSGLLLQFINPKVILYGITTVSTFIVPYYKSLLILSVNALFLAFVGFVATCSWSLFGSIFQRFLVKNHRLVNTIMSLLLVYCAVSLFL